MKRTGSYVPIFEKDGNRFFPLTKDFVGDDEQAARHIGLGAQIVECILWGATNTHETLCIPEQLPHRKADILGWPVAIIAGPLFDEGAAYREASDD